MDSEETQSKGRASVWSWVIGGAVGAVVVGALWGGVAYAHAGGPSLAKVGSTTISRAQLTNKLETSYGTNMVQEMISEQLITDAAKKYNITASTSQINSALSALESQYGISNSTDLSLFLAQNGMTQSDLNQILKMQVLEQNLAQRNVKVTTAQIQAYYNKNKSSFVLSGQKTAQPLSKVKSQIVAALKQQGAIPSAQLFASIATWDPITIYDSKYASVKNTLEGKTGNATGGTSAGSATTSGNTVVIPGNSTANGTGNGTGNSVG